MILAAKGCRQPHRRKRADRAGGTTGPLSGRRTSSCVYPQIHYNRYFGLRPSTTHTTCFRGVSSPRWLGAGGTRRPNSGDTMAFNPFTSFRKYQRFWMATVLLLCMITFVLCTGVGGDLSQRLLQLFQRQEGRPLAKVNGR